MKLNDDMYQVSFRGNGYTPESTVYKYLLYRSAQLTKQNGYNYFIITGGTMNKSVDTWTTPTQIHSSSYGNYYGYGSYANWYGSGNTYGDATIIPGQTYQTERYQGIIIIKMLKTVSKNQNAFKADTILSSMNVNTN